MPNFAVMSSNDTITTVIVADSLSDATELVEKSNLGKSAREIFYDLPEDAPKIGWKWDGEKFFDPNPPSEPLPTI